VFPFLTFFVVFWVTTFVGVGVVAVGFGGLTVELWLVGAEVGALAGLLIK